MDILQNRCMRPREEKVQTREWDKTLWQPSVTYPQEKNIFEKFDVSSTPVNQRSQITEHIL